MTRVWKRIDREWQRGEERRGNGTLFTPRHGEKSVLARRREIEKSAAGNLPTRRIHRLIWTDEADCFPSFRVSSLGLGNQLLGASMTRIQSLIIFTVAFIVNTLTYYFSAPATDIDKLGKIGVLFFGIGSSFGSIILPLTMVTIWAIIVFLRKKRFPSNFVPLSAQLSAVFLIGSAFTTLIS
jgi:hypothetical protein